MPVGLKCICSVAGSPEAFIFPSWWTAEGLAPLSWTPHPCAGGRWQSLAPHVRISVSGSKRSLCVSGRPPPMGESGDAGPSPAHSQLPVAGGKQGLAPGSPCPGRAGESPDRMGQGQAEKSRGPRS